MTKRTKYRVFAEHYKTGEIKKFEVLIESIERMHVELGNIGWLIYKYYPID